MVDTTQPALRARMTWPALATAAYLAVLAATGLALLIKVEIALGHRVEFWFFPALCLAVFVIVGGLLRRRRWGYMLAVSITLRTCPVVSVRDGQMRSWRDKFVNFIVTTYLAVRLIADDDVDTFFARKPGSSS